MIRVRELEKRYQNVEALRGVSLELQPGKISGILGPNGCGKTTLIKSILGLVVPDRGEIDVLGKSIREGWDYRAQLGYMPQNSQFPGHLCGEELFNMVEDIRGVKGVRREELIELFEVRSHLKKPMGNLSGGTRQKVSAIMAFMFDPQILILDEPTVGLDPIAAVRLKQLIRDFAQKNRTVLLVTHMVAEIEQLVSEMFFILDGKIRFAGPLEELRKQAGMDALDEAVVKLMTSQVAEEGRI